MSWESKRNVLTELLQDEVEGTETLYTDIPFFMRTRLNKYINQQEWSEVRTGCQNKMPESETRALQMYTDILNYMKEFIDCQRSARGDLCTLMCLDRKAVMRNFGDDAKKFVTAMADCLENEQRLLFLHSVSSCQKEEENKGEEMFQESIAIQNLKSYVQDLENQMLEYMACSSDVQSVGRVENQQTSAADNMGMAHTAERRDKSIIIRQLKQVVDNLPAYVDSLSSEVTTWRNADAKSNNFTGPFVNLIPVSKNFTEFGWILNRLKIMFSNNECLHMFRRESGELISELTALQQTLSDVMKSFFACNLVVTQHPKGIINIENKSAKEDVAGSESPSDRDQLTNGDAKAKSTKRGGNKKEQKDYKSKNSGLFDTEVKVLGGESFFSSLEVYSYSIQLISDSLYLEKDRTSPQAASYGQQNLVNKDNCTVSETDVSIRFNQVVVKSFSRPNKSETKQAGAKRQSVCLQFFRILYKISMRVHGEEYELETVSLPFAFKTGTVQVLDIVGARMWYCSCGNVYTSRLPDSLPVEDVINMLSARVANLDLTSAQLNGTPNRKLTERERAFLRSKLPVNNKNEVTLTDFLKTSLENPRCENENLEINFFSWFYAVVNSLEKHLWKVWQAGIIYGMCSHQEAEEFLLQRDIPEGTVILRPSISVADSTKSLKKAAALSMEVKQMSEEGAYKVETVPLYMDFVQANGLYGALKGIQDQNKKKLVSYIQGVEEKTPLSLKELKKYSEVPCRMRIYPDYNCVVENEGNITVKPIPKKDKSGQDPQPPPSKQSRQATNKSNSSGDTGNHSASTPCRNGPLGRMSSTPQPAENQAEQHGSSQLCSANLPAPVMTKYERLNVDVSQICKLIPGLNGGVIAQGNQITYMEKLPSSLAESSSEPYPTASPHPMCGNIPTFVGETATQSEAFSAMNGRDGRRGKATKECVGDSHQISMTRTTESGVQPCVDTTSLHLDILSNIGNQEISGEMTVPQNMQEDDIDGTGAFHDFLLEQMTIVDPMHCSPADSGFSGEQSPQFLADMLTPNFEIHEGYGNTVEFDAA